MNPMTMMKALDNLKKLRAAHPKFMAFLRAAKPDMREGAVIEVSVTNPEGEKKTANLRISADDVANLQAILSLRK